MRPKVLLIVFVFGVSSLGFMWLVRPGQDAGENTPAGPAASITDIRAASGAPRVTGRPLRKIHVGVRADSQTDLPASQPAHEDQVGDRIAQLMDLAMSDDTDSLWTILSELTNREPRIREAAVTAAVQFKSPSAIAALQNACSQTDDPEEKLRLLGAIEFLAVSE